MSSIVVKPTALPQRTPLISLLSNQSVMRTIVTFTATGSVQTWTVPAGVTNFKFALWGSGGNGQNNGTTITNGAGSGGFVEGNLITTPGTVYSIVVGRASNTGIGNGGGSTGGTGAGGGGFSGIFSSTPAAGTVIAIAGGGGGSGTNGGGVGGGGGYPNGLNATGVTGGRGQGGTQTAGGGGAVTGTQLQGASSSGGGGGGGWWGGGAGQVSLSSSGGGGGSSTYTSIVINPRTANGATSSPPGGTFSPLYVRPFGQSGTSGLVVIAYSTLPAPLQYIFSQPTETLLQSFTYTGSVQSYTIPAGTTRVRIYAWGAGGGNGSTGAGGGGGFVSGTRNVVAGQTLSIIIGTVCNGTPSLAQGGGGGLSVSTYVGGGGGFSGVFFGATPSKANCICMAGGGGAGNNTNAVNLPLGGGPGGYPSGLPGSSDVGSGRVGGGGGTDSGGGAGAGGGTIVGNYNGIDLFGGDGTTTAADTSAIQGPGSGGGGWFGGGASCQDSTNAGGGGGSGYITGLQQPVQIENGFYSVDQVSTASAGGESSPYWQTPYGQSAQNGYVVITKFQ